MSNCVIGSPEGNLDLYNSLLAAIFKIKSEDEFLKFIQKEFSSRYTSQPNLQCVEGFKEVLNEIISDPFINSAVNNLWLKKYNPQYIDKIINPDSVLDNLILSDISTGLEETADTFIYSTYGSTSPAKVDMEIRFRSMLRDSIFFDYRSGNEVTSQQLLNENIKYYLDLLWNTIKLNIPQLKLNDNINEVDIDRIKEYFDKQNLYPSVIDVLFNDSKINNDIKKVFDAFQSFFILRNFDRLLNSYYPKLFNISQFRFGTTDGDPQVMLGNRYKYHLSGLNHNLNTSFGEDKEFNDVVKEAPDIVKLFFDTSFLFDRNNDAIIGTLDTRQVTYIWGLIKNIQYSEKGNIPFRKETLDNLLEDEYITDEEYNYLCKYLGNNNGFDEYEILSFSDLIKDSYEDNSFTYPLIFKLLSVDYKSNPKRYTGLDFGVFNPKQYNLIYSIYKQVFSDESKIKKAWNLREISDFNNLPKCYYQYITQYFNTQSHILMYLYSLDVKGHFILKTLGQSSLDNHVLYELDMINGMFSASVDQSYESEDFNKGIKKFNGHILDRNNLKENDDKGYIEVKLNDDNTILRMNKSFLIQISTNNGKTFKSIKNINLEENKTLLNFIQYVLNLESNEFSNVILPSLRLKITDKDLLSAAMNVLYNYSVSCELIKEPSIFNAKNKVKSFYGSGLDEKVRFQKHSKELNSFLTNVITSSFTPIRETMDMLNGILREASAKGADGNTINTMSTSMLVDKFTSMVRRGLLENDDYICNSFTILNGGYVKDSDGNYVVDSNGVRVKTRGAYRGFVNARDVKMANGDSKRFVDLTAAEMSVFGFVYDFIAPYFDEKENTILVHPLVGSDKPPVIKILIDLNEKFGKKKLKDMSVGEIQSIAKLQLGEYYSKVYDYVEGQWQKLNEIAKSEITIGDYGSPEANEDVQWFLNFAKTLDLFGLESNFNGINTAIDGEEYDADGNVIYKGFIQTHRNKVITTHNAFVNGIATLDDLIYTMLEKLYIVEYAKINDLSHTQAELELKSKPNHVKNMESYINDYFADRASTAVTNLLHALETSYQTSDKQIEVVATQFYVPDGLHFGINPALALELYKWGVKDNNWFKQHVNKDLYKTSYKNGKEFFKIKNRQVVSDILLFGGFIGVLNQFGKKLEGPVAKLAEFDGGNWLAKNNKIALAKLNFVDNDGKTTTFNITDLSSLERIYYIQNAFYSAKFYTYLKEFELYKDLDSWLNSADFTFEALEDLMKLHEHTVQLELSSEKDANKVLEDKTNYVNYLLNKGAISEEYALSLKENFQKHRNNLKSYPKLDTIDINPLIEKYNTISYLFGLEYANSAVGSYAFHKGKNKKDMRAYCSQAYAQQVKRNVILTATKQQMLLNELNGMPAIVKSAEILNTRDLVYTIFGEEANPFDDDGATYEGAVTNKLENNSLGGSAVGVDKKDIFWSLNPKSGANKFVKTAVFAATNNRIRDSKFYRCLNYQSLVGNEEELIPYLIKNGISDPDGGLNITRDFRRKRINYGDFSYQRTYLGEDPFKEGEGNGLYYLQFYEVSDNGNLTPINAYNGDIVTISDIEFNPTTGMTEFLVNKTSKQAVKLKNMHDVYLFFGGDSSMTLSENLILGKQPITEDDFDESSIDRCVLVVNSVGERIGNGQIRNQKQVNQYLKKAIIHYFPTTEATKAGASNPNLKKYLETKKLKLAFTNINLYDAGPQLNAEHESNESVISMMTQVVNTLGARGYTAEQADQVYKALKALTMVSLNKFIDSLDYSKVGNIDDAKSCMEDFITEVIRKSIRPSSATANPKTLGEALLQAAYATINENKGNLTYDIIKQTLPIDNQVLLKSFMSNIASTLTKSCIRLKFPGTMDVLSPSNGIFKLYDGKLLSSYRGQDVSKLPNKPVLNLTDIQIGDTYYAPGYYTGDYVKVEDPRDYYFLKRYVLETGIQLEEVVSIGRDLGGYNVKFEDEEHNTYNIYDLAVVRQAYKENSSNIREILQQLLFALSNYYDANTVRVGVTLLTYDKNGNLVVEYIEKDVKINKQSIEVLPYEVIMSMLYQIQFGLKAGDDVKTIIEDNLFFFKRLLEKHESKAAQELFDIELVTIDGNNRYLVTDNVPKGFRKIHVTPTYDEAGKLWYVDLNNKPIELLSSEDDEIYSNGKIRIIKTKNISFYLDTIKHSRVNLSSRIKSSDKIIDIIQQFDNSESKSAKYFVKKFDNFFNNIDVEVEDIEGDTTDSLQKVFNLFNSTLDTANKATKLFKNFLKRYNDFLDSKLATILDILNNEEIIDKLSALKELATQDKWLSHILETSQNIQISFEKSLEILAARIPAQCMQSFMAMKIVGFDNSGLNTAYVSRWLIYLLGSDYDIDKVSLLGFRLKNGLFVKWSPYMDMSSKKLLKASENLPFPTGREVKIIQLEDNGSIQELCYNIFTSTENGLELNENDKISSLKNLAKLLIKVDKLGGLPYNLQKVNEVKKFIDKHNIYINNPKINIVDALMNYVSSLMYNIGKDPVNLYLGQSSVDSENGAVKKIEKASEGLSYAKKLLKRDPGALTILAATTELTNGGKKNTGIVASSMKVFEGFYQYVCNVLNDGTLEEKQNLLINREICGKLVKLIANAYLLVIESELPIEIKQALEEVDLEIDANLLDSGFLSASTDNTKNPILPKINATESMIGLYLAGVTLGLDLDTLVTLLTSNAALKIAQIIPSNLITGYTGHSDVRSVIKYIKFGPKGRVPIKKSVLVASKLPNWFVNNPTVANSLSLEGKDKEEYENILATTTLTKSKQLKLENNLREAKTWKKLRDSIVFDKIKLKDGTEISTFDEILKLCFMLEEMKSFIINSNLNRSLPNKMLEQINWLRKFEKLLDSRIGIIKSLTKEFSEGELDEILKPLEDYNEKLLNSQGVTIEKIINQHKHDVDFLEFSKNAEYRLLIINTYDKLKFGINIFRAMSLNSHYDGYRTACFAMSELNRSISSVWNISNYISRFYLPNNINSKTKELLVSKTIDIINSSFIDNFLSQFDFGNGNGLLLNPNQYSMFKENAEGELELTKITESIPIQLGTNEGNMTFKYIFEKFIIPKLKNKYPNNELLKSLTFIKTTKTITGDPLIKLATKTKLIPENSFEEMKIAKYKEGLDIIRNEVIDELGGIQFLDALFIYNLIVNQNVVRESSFTNLFEKYTISLGKKIFEGLTNLIQSYYDFLKTSEDLVLAQIKEFPEETMDQLLRELAPEDNSFKTGLPYIKVRDENGLLILLELDPEKDENRTSNNYNEDGEEYLEDYNSEEDYGQYEGEDEYSEYDDNDRLSDVQLSIELSKYKEVNTPMSNLVVMHSLSLNNLKDLIVPVSGQLESYKKVTWNSISKLDKVQEMGVKNMTELLIALNIMSEDGKKFIADVSEKDLMNILNTNCS